MAEHDIPESPITNETGELESIGDRSSDPMLDLLAGGRIEPVGRFVWGSNYTFLAKVVSHGEEVEAVYKPSHGEQPLWDFPDQTLAQREVTAFVISNALGWDLVPPTVLRPDGPAGGGSLQLYVDADPERHYFTFSEAEKQRLRPVALFDAVINNADRKGGHVLLGASGRIWLIDHGVCFHVEEKLRTVIWDFAGETIPAELVHSLQRLKLALSNNAGIRRRLEDLLDPSEINAIGDRVRRLISSGQFPRPGAGRPYPWPLV